MSRPVKNLRFMGTAGPTKGTPPVRGSSKAYGAKTEGDGRANLGAGQIDKASQPRFDGPSQILGKYTYPDPS